MRLPAAGGAAREAAEACTMTLALFAIVAGCGDNAVAPRDAAPSDARLDAPVGEPDLTLVDEEMDGTLLVAPGTFTADSCEVVEGCVGAPGVRRLLRFDTVTANLGTADISLGAPPPPGVSAGVFVWSPCHMHHHVGGYAEYELRDASGLVVAGHKQAFCLHDVEEVRPGTGSRGYTCARQGLSAGWADVYTRDVPCQWIDVTSVAPGTYTLRVEINRSNQLPDRDATNNDWSASITL